MPVKQKVRTHALEYVNKSCGVELNSSQNRDLQTLNLIRAFIYLFIILYTNDNSRMDLSRESQTSTNTSECEESK